MKKKKNIQRGTAGGYIATSDVAKAKKLHVQITHSLLTNAAMPHPKHPSHNLIKYNKNNIKGRTQTL